MRPGPSPRSILALAAVAAFTIWITWRAKALELGAHRLDAPSILVGKPAPDFALESLDGRKIPLVDYRGKNLVVTFWASWCGPCRMELPVLNKFYQQTHKTGSDFEVLAVSIDATKDDAQGAATTPKIPFPVLLDMDSHLAGSYHVDAIPMLFVIDKAGKVMVRYCIYSALAIWLVTIMHPIFAFAIVLLSGVSASLVAPSSNFGSFLPEWLRHGLFFVLPSMNLLSESKFLALTSASLEKTPWTEHLTALAYGLDWALVCLLFAFWAFARRSLARE